MDRRRLLRGAFGVGLAAVTTKLWVPPVSTVLAQPERTVFVPPANGWPAFGEWQDESALGYIQRFDALEVRRIPGTDIMYVDTTGEDMGVAFTVPRRAAVVGDYLWSLPPHELFICTSTGNPGVWKKVVLSRPFSR